MMNSRISGSGGFVLGRHVFGRTVQFILTLATVVLSPAWSQEAPKFSAREIFYGDPAQPPKPAKLPDQTVKSVKTDDHPVNTTSRRRRATEKGPVVSTGTTNRERSDNYEMPTHTVLVNASSGAPLGVRVSLLKVANGQAIEVDPDAEFHPGDRLRLNVEVSDTGYLYVLNRGSSGTWMPMFPSPEIPNASNLVKRGVKYRIPSETHVFTIHNPAGAEKLFVIFSRKPELDIEKLTDDMSRRDRPASKSPPLTKTYALNLPRMTDASVDRLRTTYSRDLIIEKVDEDTDPQKGKALYAAIPTGGQEARVVLDVQIKHP